MNKEKFINFLDALQKIGSDNSLFESIKKGFKICFEDISKRDYIKTHAQEEQFKKFTSLQAGFFLSTWIPLANSTNGDMVLLRNRGSIQDRVEIDPDGVVRMTDKNKNLSR